MASFRSALLASVTAALGLTAASPALAAPLSFTNKTNVDGLGATSLRGVYASGGTI